MRFGIRAVDAAFVVWTAAWLVAAGAVYSSLQELGNGGEAVRAAGAGLHETSEGLERAGTGLHETADALDLLSDLPFVDADPGAGVEQTADDLDRFAVAVRRAGRDAQTTGEDASEAADTLAVVLGLAVALGPTLPAGLLYLLLRPLVAQRLSSA
jgi:hypothetical protein